ncbi:MAG: protein kinase [Deltaproteobacteria bacterium]|nr:protein kinase [Deltaproteobacteria bacterium]
MTKGFDGRASRLGAPKGLPEAFECAPGVWVDRPLIELPPFTDSKKHVLVRPLARSGIADVIIGFHEGKQGQAIIVKAFRKNDADTRQIVKAAAKRARKLDHPGIAKVVDLLLWGDRLFLVREYLDGIPLEALIRSALRSGPLTVGFAVRVVLATCRVLHYAWAAPGADGKPPRVLHGGIHAGNILLSKRGDLVVTDFLLSSPLLADPDVELDEVTDVHAIGMLLLRMLSVRRRNDASKGAIVPPPEAVGELVDVGVDADLVRIVERAVDPDADQRQQSISEIGRDLEWYLWEHPDRVNLSIEVLRLAAEADRSRLPGQLGPGIWLWDANRALQGPFDPDDVVRRADEIRSVGPTWAWTDGQKCFKPLEELVEEMQDA